MQSVSRKTFIKLIGFSLIGFYVSVCKKLNKQIYLYFSEDEVAIMEKWSEAILPDNQTGMPSYVDASVVRRLDEEFSFVSNEIQEEFHSAILALNFLPFFYGFTSRFHKLDLESRRKFLFETSESNSDIVRAIIGNLKLVTFLVYYGHKSTWKQIGYDGPFGNPPEKWSESRIYYKQMTGELK
jgi:hypothetical protein